MGCGGHFCGQISWKTGKYFLTVASSSFFVAQPVRTGREKVTPTWAEWPASHRVPRDLPKITDTSLYCSDPQSTHSLKSYSIGFVGLLERLNKVAFAAVACLQGRSLRKGSFPDSIGVC